MIIIDVNATHRLIQALKAIDNLESKYCISINKIHNDAKFLNQILTLSQKYFAEANLYFCEDGEIFILSPYTPARSYKKAMLEIAEALNIKPADRVGELYDLALQTRSILSVLEKKIENSRKAEEIAKKQKAQEQAVLQFARKRQEILDQNVSQNAEQIAAQRKLRSEPTLMIIEDDPFSRRLVKNVLQKEYQLESLESGENALAFYANTAPDLLFLDINLPDVSGHELLQRIIALDPKAYIVMLSGNSDKNNVIQAMTQGAVGFVAKPFSRSKLLQYIESCPTISEKKG